MVQFTILFIIDSQRKDLMIPAMYIIVMTNCTTNKLALRHITACTTHPRLLINSMYR